MPLDSHALGSIAASLQELTERIGHLTSGSSDDDEALVEVREVERQLQTAGRRLTKILRQLD